MDQVIGLRVLIVEDDPDIALLLQRLFGMVGLASTWAADEFQALQRLEADPHDLLTLDLNMPRLSGLEVLAQIRATPLLAELPVIVLTSWDELPERVQAQANAVMTKPFDVAVLLATVSDLLGQAAPRARAVGA